MATATKIDNKWRCKVSWYEPDPENKDKKKRFYKYLFGFKTKREALKEGDKFEVYKAQNRISTKNPLFC